MRHQAKKRFGQNFLTDKNLLRKIVNDANIQGKNVLEIGPGLGALTQFLSLDAKKYFAYEIDLSLKETLKSFESDKATIFFKDFLEDDVQTRLKNYFGDEEIHLVGNLPYNITTPIIFKFLEIDNLKSATIMVQKEVGDRVISETNLKSYNAFSAILQYYAEVSKVVNVGRKMFTPVPQVDSMVIKITKLERRLTPELEKLYIEIVKKSFQHKRKTLLNNLSTGFDLPKDKVLEFLKRFGFDENTRAELLTVTDFIEITKQWKSLS
ncbi:16S rRNA (adenine(1518)-N(6)/adenine(1519)-N(6))-dimethyltransferase RsmA [Acholeplasma equirhinis]|uniref:16S rRNA (adenine(1518)-N(6)/adenine(1519)-N(6))- dimethyltransferase RsmA n=1 Tax=Acholeplasma equirhinis TaxID=555393 RepID=UPI00197A86C4|nr:16S rRNA (adenine(1518)-N(6)/adenine(1519)-N(6))-dimethyltransferase RsmA [Acholeplasma equirhinis]MBN3491065.1 16S rRNA (adenine(1518)-N(6)/adenine(1519)-N(6))-dimethyltransferase RsmA [Acholeplasma equirhinis]